MGFGLLGFLFLSSNLYLLKVRSKRSLHFLVFFSFLYKIGSLYDFDVWVKDLGSYWILERENEGFRGHSRDYYWACS